MAFFVSKSQIKYLYKVSVSNFFNFSIAFPKNQFYFYQNSNLHLQWIYIYKIKPSSSQAEGAV